MPETNPRRPASLKTKTRLDRLLVQREWVETRQKAQALIMAGRVRVEGKKVEKAGTLVDPASQVEVVGPSARYVGRSVPKSSWTSAPRPEALWIVFCSGEPHE